MNKFELVIYNWVKDRPALKQRIVNAYQAVLGLVPQTSIATELPVVERRGFFFGFHDKTPFSTDGTLLLAHRNLIGDRVVRAGDPAEVGIFQGTNWRDFHPVGRTHAWNWQLGSMLQWFDARSGLVVYNDAAPQGLRAIIRTLSGQMVSELPHPVVHVTSDGRLASSYNFLRVEAAMPGYGAVVAQPVLGSNEDNWFRIFECSSGRTRFELSLAQAAAISPHPSMEGAFHFFHHSLFNPSNRRAFFLHRWIDRNRRRWTRMFSVGVDGEDLFLFPMDEMVSHTTWPTDTEIFTYARYPDLGDGYFLVEDRTGRARQFFRNVLNSDGHPTLDRRRSIVITDTYPDRFRNQFLVLGLPDTDRVLFLCRTHLPRTLRMELQVDLHPRLHPHRNITCFDSGHSGTRSLMTIDFSSVLK